jgi:AGCS family alanine or glycine:cation symporter
MKFTMKIAAAILCSLIPFLTIAQDEVVDSVQVEQVVEEPTVAVAVEEPVLSMDDRINEFMGPIADDITSVIFFQVDLFGFTIPFVLIWLSLGALLFTLYFGFINITGFRHAIDVVRGKFDDPNSKEAGEVSHFQALTAALSGTVGVGNIAGVAIAVSLGGPGATFWMIVAGLLGMSAKFVECTLGTKYRRENSDGSVSGGPMYYLSNGLAKKGEAMGVVGKILAILFAIACIGGSFGGGCMVQINQATKQLISVTGGDGSFLSGQSWMFGAAMAALVGLIIIGGIKSIAKVTDKVVPFMVGIYVLGALIVLGGNLSSIPSAFGQIFSGAFAADAMYGGIIGVMIQGFKRAAFSNEAGIGSASIAHSAAKTNEPVSEGMVSLLEPFIDTVVICTMTALVIVISGYGEFTSSSAHALASSGDLQAIELTSSAFSQTIPWFPIVLSVAVILFALSTMISWSYYGLKAWTYLFGESKTADISYKAIFCLMVIIGSAISARSVFDFGDAMIFAMCFPNVLGLYFLAPEVKEDLKDYLRRVKSGEIKRFD